MTTTEHAADRAGLPPWPRGVRGLLRAAATADPGLGRLRSVLRSVAVLAVTAAVVLGGAALAGGPVSAAVTGVVVAFVTSVGANDATFPARAVTTAWTAVAASVAAVVASLLGAPGSAAGVAGFVALGVVVVFLQRLGPRGFAPGMAGFITYLSTSLTGLTPAGLPLAVGGALLAAATVVATRWLLRPRRPERTARHVLAALEARAALVALALATLVRGVEGAEPARRRTRRRLGALRRATALADDSLAQAEDAVVPGADNEALGVRVFDLRLGLEHLAGLLDPDGDDAPAGPRPDLADLLDDVGRALLDRGDERWGRVDAHLAADAPPDEHRVRRTLAGVVRAWRTPPDPRERAEDAEEAGDAAGSSGPAPPPVTDTVRRAVQVALAVGLAALVGPLVSPSQWFFAVVVAFVVFISSSSRGDVLTEGWQRTVGTLVGVLVGIGLAFLLRGDAVATLALLVVCLVGALYAMGLSSTALMFFITVAIALVYGLVGQFTVDVLLMRLAETAVGAVIGIAVSFLVLPTRTRTTFGDATARFLRAVHGVVDGVVEALAARPVTGAVPRVDDADVRELRDAYAQVEAAAGPLTEGLAGVLDRTGHRRALRVVAACDHHARLLLHLARDHATALGTDDGGADALRDAAAHVVSRLDGLVGRLDRTVDDDGGTRAEEDADEHGRVFGSLDAASRQLGQDGAGEVLESVGARLRAIDRALTDIGARSGDAG